MKSSSVSRFFLFFALRLNGSAAVAVEMAGDEVVDKVGDALGTEDGPATADWLGSILGGADSYICPLMWTADADVPGMLGEYGTGECLRSRDMEASEA